MIDAIVGSLAMSAVILIVAATLGVIGSIIGIGIVFVFRVIKTKYRV